MSAESKFKITTKIRDVLLAVPEITAIVGEKIYPIVAPDKTEGDFIVYQREKYSKKYTKMGIYEQLCLVNVIAVSGDYDNSQELAYRINEALEGIHPGLNMDIRLEDSIEYYGDSKYVQELLFDIK
jgi:hypothetical protein